jgi:hypothetical protein
MTPRVSDDSFLLFRNVLLGEHDVGQNPDCPRNGPCLPPVQNIEVSMLQTFGAIFATLHFLPNWPNKL